MCLGVGVLLVCLQSEGYQMWLHVSLLLNSTGPCCPSPLLLTGPPSDIYQVSRADGSKGAESVRRSGDLRNRLLMETSPSGTAVSKFNTCTICVESRRAPLKPAP